MKLDAILYFEKFILGGLIFDCQDVEIVDLTDDNNLVARFKNHPTIRMKVQSLSCCFSISPKTLIAT